MKSSHRINPRIIVVVSADAEWRIVENTYPGITKAVSPFGCWFAASAGQFPFLFFQGGWGKISAAASTQYAIQRWNPRLIINLGTCGGLKGMICKGEILLVEETIIYDLIELMGDQQEALAHYTTKLDLSWLQTPYPIPVQRGRLVSADRDICPADIPLLQSGFGATASDWESGAIAWVAKHNNVPCLILRGVSDLVDQLAGGEAYGDPARFIEGTKFVMQTLLQSLPGWLQSARKVIEG
jgi:adenosylhomocysteine nucleosidase